MEDLSRTFRKVGVQVHAKPINTIRSMLVFPKDKPKKCDRSCVIYGPHCSNCPPQYVSETERPLKHRITEHRKDSSPLGHTLKLRTTSSPIMLRFWKLNPDISNVASMRLTTLHLWSQTLIRTRADTAYPRSTHPLSSHVTAGHPVFHMTSFPLLITADAERKFK